MSVKCAEICLLLFTRTETIPVRAWWIWVTLPTSPDAANRGIKTFGLAQGSVKCVIFSCPDHSLQIHRTLTTEIIHFRCQCHSTDCSSLSIIESMDQPRAPWRLWLTFFWGHTSLNLDYKNCGMQALQHHERAIQHILWNFTSGGCPWQAEIVEKKSTQEHRRKSSCHFWCAYRKMIQLFLMPACCILIWRLE